LKVDHVVEEGCGGTVRSWHVSRKISFQEPSINEREFIAPRNTAHKGFEFHSRNEAFRSEGVGEDFDDQETIV